MRYWRCGAAASVLALCACTDDAQPVSIVAEGCYALTWTDSISQRLEVLPRRIHLTGGPASGGIAPDPAAAETTLFWGMHTERHWARVQPDSVVLWFGNDMGGTRVRAALTADGLVGAALTFGDMGPQPTEPEDRVAGRRDECRSVAPAT